MKSTWPTPSRLYFFLMSTNATRGRFLALFLKEKNLDNAQIGYILTAGNLAALATPLFGHCADKYGPVRIMSICAILGSAFFFGFWFVNPLLDPSPSHADVLKGMVTQGLAMLFVAPVLPATEAYTLSWIGLAENGGDDESPTVAKRRYGEYRLWGGVGWGFASMLIGLFADRYSIASVVFPNIISFTTCFVLVTLSEPDPLLLRYRREDEVNNKPVNVSTCQFLARLARTPTTVAFFFSYFCLGWGMSLVEQVLFIFFVEDLQASYLMCAVSVLITVSFELPIFRKSMYFLTKFGPRKLLYLGMFSYVIRAVGYTMFTAEYRWGVLTLEFMHGFTIAFVQIAAVDYVTRLVAVEGGGKLEALGQAILSTLRAIGTVCGTFIGTQILDAYGSSVMYRSTALLVCVSLAVLFTAETVTGHTMEGEAYVVVDELDVELVEEIVAE